MKTKYDINGDSFYITEEKTRFKVINICGRTMIQGTRVECLLWVDNMKLITENIPA